MLTGEQTVVLRSIAALEREEPERIRSVSAIAQVAARRGEAHTDETVKERVDDLIEDFGADPGRSLRGPRHRRRKTGG